MVEMLRPSFGLSPLSPRTTSITTAGAGQLRGPWPSLSSSSILPCRSCALSQLLTKKCPKNPPQRGRRRNTTVLGGAFDIWRFPIPWGYPKSSKIRAFYKKLLGLKPVVWGDHPILRNPLMGLLGLSWASKKICVPSSASSDRNVLYYS